MADLERMERALRNAHDAGDTEAARRLAQAIKQARGSQPAAPSGTGSKDPIMDQVRASAFKAAEDYSKHGPGSRGTPLTAIAQGMTMGWGDEIGGAIDYATGRAGSMAEGVEGRRKRMDEYQKRNSIASTALEIGGGALTGGGLASRGATLMGRASGLKNVAAAGAEGAAYGGVSGAGYADDGDRVEGATTGALVGGLSGVALERLANGLAKSRIAREAKKKAPTTEQLQAEADALYEMADRSGVAFEPPKVQSFVSNLVRKLDDEGLDDELHRPVIRALEKMATDGQNPLGFKQIDNIRKFVSRNAGGSPDASTRRLAGIMIDEIDDFVEQTSSRLGGIASKAREAYARKSRAQLMERITREAERQAASTYSGGNYENAMRQKVKNVLNSRRLSRGLTADQKEAMDAFVEGAPMQNFLRRIGKLSPEGGGLMSMLMFGGGVTAPHAFMPLAATGFMAKRAADAGVRRQLNNLDILARTGSMPGQPNPQNVAAPLAGFVAGTRGDQ